MPFICKWALAALALLGLGACGGGAAGSESGAHPADMARAQAEMVRRANALMPPVETIIPAPFAPAELDRHDLLREGCRFAPGTNLAPRLITREADAFIKIDGVIQRLAADPGAPLLPARTRSVYAGRHYSLRVDIQGEEGMIWLRDRWDRIVYQGSGPVTCTGTEPALPPADGA